jgi:hypothetical protein
MRLEPQPRGGPNLSYLAQDRRRKSGDGGATSTAHQPHLSRCQDVHFEMGERLLSPVVCLLSPLVAASRSALAGRLGERRQRFSRLYRVGIVPPA